MAVKFISIKCPECGAPLDVEEGRQQIYCSYCGTKIMIQNDNEYIIRNIDEAGIKQAETDRIIRLKQMEIAEKKRVSAEKTQKLKIIISLALAIVGILMLTIGYLAGGDSNSGLSMLSVVGLFPLMGAIYVWLLSKKEEYDDDFGDKVRVPSLTDYKRQSYRALEAKFTSAGFTNIKCVRLNDLTVGLLKQPDMVESITINGRSVTTGGEKFPPNAAVVITYHSLR